MLSALASARESARGTQCKNNLKQIGIGLAQYEQKWNMYPIGNLRAGLRRYFSDEDGGFRCPCDPDTQRKDTYSINYRGGHPAVIGDDREVVMCGCHTGPPFGVFRDGHVGDVTRLKMSDGVMLTGHLSEGGQSITFPYTFGPGAAALWFEAGGQWNKINVRNVMISGLFDTGARPTLVAGYATQDPTESFNLHAFPVVSGGSGPCIAVNFDILGSVGRFYGEGGWPEVHENYGGAQPHPSYPWEQYCADGDMSACPQNPNKKFTLALNAKPKIYRNKGKVSRSDWAGGYPSRSGTYNADHQGYIARCRSTGVCEYWNLASGTSWTSPCLP